MREQDKLALRSQFCDKFYYAHTIKSKRSNNFRTNTRNNFRQFKAKYLISLRKYQSNNQTEKIDSREWQEVWKR